jgi:transcriptional regulator with XRE-family HTH domain
MAVAAVLETETVPRRKETLSFGERLRRVRRGLHITQKQLADKLQLEDPSYIAKLETGVIDNPRLDSIQKIAEALGVAVSELTGEVGGDVEKAIMSSELTDDDKRMLVRLYRSLKP